MGLPPDGAIVSLGACFFDYEKCEIGPKFHRPVHLATSVGLGMKIEPATVLWWLRQSADAQAAISFNLNDIRVVLDEFRAFINEHSREPDVRPWGHGASFDLTILSTAYKLAGQDTPWRFGRERCFRTFRNWYGHVVPYEPEKREGVHHNALDDAVFQAEHFFKIKEALGGRRLPA